MNRKKYMLAHLPLIAIILEILPYGAVMNFALPATDGTIGHFRETHSYFSLLPFGYANFGPFLTAIVSCILLIFGILQYINDCERFIGVIKVLSVIGIITSIMPLMFGINYFSIVGALITVSLCFTAYYSFKK